MYIHVSIYMSPKWNDVKMKWCQNGIRPTQSIMYVPLQVNRFKKIILLIVRYKYLKSCSRRFYCPNLILCTRLCGTMFITQPSCPCYFHLTESVRRKWFVLAVYQFRKGISAGPALKYFTWFIGAGGMSKLNNVKMKWCQNERMSKWNDVKMKWCQNEMMSKRKDVKMEWCQNGIRPTQSIMYVMNNNEWWGMTINSNE